MLQLVKTQMQIKIWSWIIHKNNFNPLWITKQSSARAFCGNVIAIAFAWKTSDPPHFVKNTFDTLLIRWKGWKIICDIAIIHNFQSVGVKNLMTKPFWPKKSRRKKKIEKEKFLWQREKTLIINCLMTAWQLYNNNKYVPYVTNCYLSFKTII